MPVRRFHPFTWLALGPITTSLLARISQTVHRISLINDTGAFFILTPSVEVLANPSCNLFPSHVRPRHSPQRRERRRMLPRKPDPPLRHALPERDNRLIERHLRRLTQLLIVIDLPIRVAPVPSELVVLPVRRVHRFRGALGIVCRVIWEA